MVAEDYEGGFTEEVEGRLEDIFGEEEIPAELEQQPKPVQKSPLRELKTIVLSIDWEITDEVMLGFVEQVAKLQDVFRNDKIVLVFLQLLGSIGEYIRSNLGKSHPDAFKILNSLFNQLELVVHSEDLSELEKKKILTAELNQYKTLKSKLIPSKDKAGKAPIAPKPTKRQETDIPRSEPAPLQPGPGVSADVIRAVEDLKKTLQSELNALREEIKTLKEEIAKH